MTTIHAYTANRSIVDSGKKDFRSGRAGAANLVPASTGAAVATTRAGPQFKGKFDGVAVRRRCRSDRWPISSSSRPARRRWKIVDQGLVEVMSWYDNEWGYGNQMVREALQLSGTESSRAI